MTASPHLAAPHPAAPHPATPLLASLHRDELELLRRDDLTVDDIVNLPEDLHYELIDGRLVLTSLALPFHQLLSAETGYAIREHCPDEFIINIEQAILIDRRNELRPDHRSAGRARHVHAVLPGP